LLVSQKHVSNHLDEFFLCYWMVTMSHCWENSTAYIQSVNDCCCLRTPS